jgi:hypothetical protein
VNKVNKQEKVEWKGWSYKISESEKKSFLKYIFCIKRRERKNIWIVGRL